MSQPALVSSLRVVLTGRVQGLGFRPFVFRLAKSMGVRGYVANSGRGVVVMAQGPLSQKFVARILSGPPPLARIVASYTKHVKVARCAGFTIRGSAPERGAGVEVLPDLGTCRECRREILDPRERRFHYAFTNCTQCGPRYTIIESLPYDRPRTSMRAFEMCQDCKREYSDATDRRFHAQPIACPLCGPAITLMGPECRRDPKSLTPNPVRAIEVAARALLAGKIVAVKSLGGFQLACDATNQAAVTRLRRRKARPDKPLALMVDSVTTAKLLCRVSRTAAEMLKSAAAPIVLLPRLSETRLPGVAPGNPYLGIMLAYSPLHILLLTAVRRRSGHPAVLVMTSANRKDDPMAATDSELRAELGSVPDLVLTHNRQIRNRCDDSVLLADDGQRFRNSNDRTPAGLMVRRARGYAPQPIELPPVFHVKHPVLAVGAEFKNTFCLAAGNRAFLSPHIGTVGTAQGEQFWLETLASYQAWTGIRPELVACDLHPDYASTRLAERLARRLKLPLVRVQHHHAHIASVMAEQGIADPVLGLAFDGTGYGMDRAVWGGEFLLVRPDLTWQRLAHLEYLQLVNAGAELADPAKVARSYLEQVGGPSSSSHQTPSSKRPGMGVCDVPPRGIHTSSLGRLFDAVAGLSGICRHATFDGQAAIAMEAAAVPQERGHWLTPDILDFSVSPAVIRLRPILLKVSRETSAGVPAGLVAARFHNTVAKSVAAAAARLCSARRLRTVCLSGGCFQNLRLRVWVARLLLACGLQVINNQQVPVNDGGLSLGQAVVAGRVTMHGADSGRHAPCVGHRT